MLVTNRGNRYLEDLREHRANLNDLEPEGKTRKERKKVQAWIDKKRSHLKVLLKYLDKDYSQVKKRQVPSWMEAVHDGMLTLSTPYLLCEQPLSPTRERSDYFRPSVGSLETQHAGLRNDLRFYG